MPDLYKKYYPSYQFTPGKCAWEEESGLHPYLAIAYPKKENCQDPARNSFGLRSAPFPEEYDPKFYTILITGGSVGEQLGGLSNWEKKSNYLEDDLQAGWISPTNKPFKVLNAALAGASQPSNSIQTLLFAPWVDLIVNVEGFNEFVKYGSIHRLEKPLNGWIEAAYQFENPFHFYLLSVMSNWQRRHSDLNPLGYSYGVFNVLHFFSDHLRADYDNKKQILNPFPDYQHSWSQEKRNLNYLKNQSRYIIQSDALAQSLGKKYVLFIQPVPLQFKQLSEDELKVVRNIAYSSDYNAIRNNLLELRRSKIAVEDLGRVFENEKSTLYFDHIHTNEKGVKIMSLEIAERLAKRYGWKTR
ncbi:MAG: hypothetical protein K2P92_01375 [Bdellovibrionaceae bacterium]|nr:hypothetical protein [Pseudobdellovibrionaceae bacterium]